MLGLLINRTIRMIVSSDVRNFRADSAIESSAIAYAAGFSFARQRSIVSARM